VLDSQNAEILRFAQNDGSTGFFRTLLDLRHEEAKVMADYIRST